MKNGSINRKNGLYEPENAILGTFLRIFGLTAAVLRKTEKKRFQQGVPGYGPQLVRYAMAFLRCIGYSYSPWAVA